jgi:hypothetical protein
MAKIQIPEGLKGRDLFKYLTENKSSLIAQKKTAWEEGFAAHKKCEPILGMLPGGAIQ